MEGFINIQWKILVFSLLWWPSGKGLRLPSLGSQFELNLCLDSLSFCGTYLILLHKVLVLKPFNNLYCHCCGSTAGVVETTTTETQIWNSHMQILIFVLWYPLCIIILNFQHYFLLFLPIKLETANWGRKILVSALGHLSTFSSQWNIQHYYWNVLFCFTYWQLQIIYFLKLFSLSVTTHHRCLNRYSQKGIAFPLFY